jgi:hypothetical protein
MYDINFANTPPPALDGNFVMEAVGRFRGVHDWAVRNGFLGGFPNMYHADHPNGRVGGSILIKPNQADIRWIYLYTDP